ncbi:MAG: amidohydrolase family protein [Pseudomonadales bacterium]
MSLAANSAIDAFIQRETPEDILEPELPIIDAHHHLWDIRNSRTEPFASAEQKVYLCEEISNDIRSCGHNITQTVFAQCGSFYRADGPELFRCVGETEFAHGIAAMSRSGVYGNARLCSGIFSTADLRIGAAVEPVLKAHMNASANFRGIRSAFPSDLNDTFLEGFTILAKHGLSFDNWSPNYERLPALGRLAEACPDVTVIVNHLGGRTDTAADETTFNNWRECIESVARCSNTVIKLGGTQMRIDDWKPAFHMHKRSTPISSEECCDLLFPWYLAAIEAFGAERCMFESNFPVDRECISFRTLWNTFKRIAGRAGASEQEKADLFSGTAARVYRLTN